MQGFPQQSIVYSPQKKFSKAVTNWVSIKSNRSMAIKSYNVRIKVGTFLMFHQKIEFMMLVSFFNSRTIRRAVLKQKSRSDFELISLLQSPRSSGVPSRQFIDLSLPIFIIAGILLFSKSVFTKQTDPVISRTEA